MFKLNMAALRQSANDSWLMANAANAANAANLANESGKSGAEISQQPPKLAKLAISQQPERTLQNDPVPDPAQVVGLATESPELVPDVPELVPELATEPPDPDRWCWPHSEAMTGREIDSFTERSSQFYRRGMQSVNAEALAYTLVNRDRDDDDRRLCLECSHLTGQRGAWRCGQWQRAGMGAAGIPAGLVLVLQRCDGFRNASR